MCTAYSLCHLHVSSKYAGMHITPYRGIHSVVDVTCRHLVCSWQLAHSYNVEGSSSLSQQPAMQQCLVSRKMTIVERFTNRFFKWAVQHSWRAWTLSVNLGHSNSMVTSIHHQLKGTSTPTLAVSQPVGHRKRGSGIIRLAAAGPRI